MGVSNYIPTGISHATSVDFTKRSVNQPVHIVQYDRSLPILAVSLYNNGQLYRLSETMEVSIRLGKPDRTFVYNEALGCDSTRTIVYFEITEQMTVFSGEYYPVVEIKDGDKIANSSTIYLVIDRNPVQTDYVESTFEYKELVEYRDEALKAKEAAKLSENNAKESEINAKESETNAKQSENNAKSSETKAKESETKAINAENDAIKYSNLSKSYAVGTDNVIRENDTEDNAKKYCETAKSSEVNAKLSETNAKAYLDEIGRKIQATNFEVDFATGELIQTTDTDYVFTINQTTGNLEWEVTA